MSNKSNEHNEHFVFRGLNCAKVLEKARRRITGMSLPVTRRDEELTATTIYAITYDFDRTLRLELLSAVLGGLISLIPSEEERLEALECALGHFRDRVSDFDEECLDDRPAKKNGGSADINFFGTHIIRNDVEAQDRAFDRALRRRAGECLQITIDDVNATYYLLRELMTEIDLIVLVCVIAHLIAEEYGGQPPSNVLEKLEKMILIIGSGLDQKLFCAGLMH